MKLMTDVDCSEFQFRIKHANKIAFLGSCFCVEIGQKFQQAGYETMINPFGTIYNPVAILNQLKNIEQEVTQEASIHFHQGAYICFDANTDFQCSEKEELLQKLNQTNQQAKAYLQTVDYVFITLGTSFVFEHLQTQRIVSNCQKVPATQFQRRSLTLCEIENALQELVKRLKRFNPNVKIIFTVSPVRHLKDGLVENNRSKAKLLLAVESVCSHSEVFYFPSFEIVNDELRDYRFYQSNLTHVNDVGISYIWDKVEQSLLQTEDNSIRQRVLKLRKLQRHIVQGNAIAKQKHQDKISQTISKLIIEYPYLKHLKNE